MANWTEYTVGGESSLEEVLLAVGYTASNPNLLDVIWDLPENAANRDSSVQKYAVQSGDRIVLPLPDSPTIAVAPGTDGSSPTTFVATSAVASDTTFRQRLARFDALLQIQRRPIDAYRSSFAPLLLR